MTPRNSMPFPPWLLVVDLLAAGLLGLGLLIVFSTDAVAVFSPGLGIGLVLIAIGAAGMLACGIALFRHLRGRRSSL